jgi:protein-tyrosine phosphatase
MTTSPPLSILFVCLGNICRSPAAEQVMRSLSPALRLDSAGTSDWHIGRPPHPPMIRAAAVRGLDLGGLRARQVALSDLSRFDRIVAMDSANLRTLRQLGGDSPAARLSLLLDHAPETGVRDVPDPYYTDDYDHALDLIEAGCRGLLRQLRAETR